MDPVSTNTRSGTSTVCVTSLEPATVVTRHFTEYDVSGSSETVLVESTEIPGGSVITWDRLPVRVTEGDTVMPPE